MVCTEVVALATPRPTMLRFEDIRPGMAISVRERMKRPIDAGGKWSEPSPATIVSFRQGRTFPFWFLGYESPFARAPRFVMTSMETRQPGSFFSSRAAADKYGRIERVLICPCKDDALRFVSMDQDRRFKYAKEITTAIRALAVDEWVTGPQLVATIKVPRRHVLYALEKLFSDGYLMSRIRVSKKKGRPAKEYTSVENGMHIVSIREKKT